MQTYALYMQQVKCRETLQFLIKTDDNNNNDLDNDHNDDTDNDVQEGRKLHRNWLTPWWKTPPGRRVMLENKTLEELGEGRRRALQEGQLLGPGDRLEELGKKGRRRWRQRRGG